MKLLRLFTLIGALACFAAGCASGPAKTFSGFFEPVPGQTNLVQPSAAAVKVITDTGNLFGPIGTMGGGLAVLALSGISHIVNARKLSQKFNDHEDAVRQRLGNYVDNQLENHPPTLVPKAPTPPSA